MLIACSLTRAHHKVICRKRCGWARKEWFGNRELKYACPFSHLGKRQEKFANICALKLCQWLLSRSAGVEKNKPLFECFYFVILQLGCVRHLVVLMDSFFQSCLQRSNLLLFVLEGARQLIGLRCNFLQSSEGKKKVRLVSIWLKLTVQRKRQKLIESDLTSYSTWIHRFQIHLQETDLTIKKKANNNTATLSC